MVLLLLTPGRGKYCDRINRKDPSFTESTCLEDLSMIAVNKFLQRTTDGRTNLWYLKVCPQLHAYASVYRNYWITFVSKQCKNYMQIDHKIVANFCKFLFLFAQSGFLFRTCA